MSTITIEISEKLAERLDAHHDRLPQILELGLSQIEVEKKPAADLRERTLQVLRSTGLVRLPQPGKSTRRRRTPLNIPGKPLSEMIIEQRKHCTCQNSSFQGASNE